MSIDRRTFLKHTGTGALALSCVNTLGSGIYGSSSQPASPHYHLPGYVERGLQNLLEEVKDWKPIGRWENLNYSPKSLGYKCIERVPMKWTHVKTFDDPEQPGWSKKRDLPIAIEEEAETAYAYSEVQTSMGAIRVDFLWRSDFDVWPTGSPVIKVLGTLAYVSCNNKILGKMRGQLFGNAYCLNPYGLQKGKTIITFDSNHFGMNKMPDGDFTIWKNPYI